MMGIDLVDFFRGRVSLRRIAIISDLLPMDSNLMVAIGERENEGEKMWNEQQHQMYHIINLLTRLEYYNAIQLWLKSGGEGKPKEKDRPEIPIMINPPGFEREQKKREEEQLRMSSTEEIAAFFGVSGKF